MVKILYKLFLGLMIALFVGFGAAVFYVSPKMPTYPMALENVKTPETMTDEEIKLQSDYNQSMEKYQNDMKPYNRNLSGILIGIAVLLLVISLALLMKVDIVGDGVMFGGLFTLAYSLIRGFQTDDSKFQFIIVTVGLVMAIAIGYVKFIRPEKKSGKKR